MHLGVGAIHAAVLAVDEPVAGDDGLFGVRVGGNAGQRRIDVDRGHDNGIGAGRHELGHLLVLLGRVVFRECELDADSELLGEFLDGVVIGREVRRLGRRDREGDLVVPILCDRGPRQGRRDQSCCAEAPDDACPYHSRDSFLADPSRSICWPLGTGPPYQATNPLGSSKDTVRPTARRRSLLTC